MRIRTACLTIGAAAMLIAIGCKSATPPASARVPQPAAVTYPARPTIAAPPVKLFHHDESSITLVVAKSATDDQLAALLWQLHDAARTKSFDALGIPQKLVDARSPIVWMHIYRSPECASEKYTSGKLPCGASYHAAADYTLGSFKNPARDDGTLLYDGTHETHLWDAGK